MIRLRPRHYERQWMRLAGTRCNMKDRDTSRWECEQRKVKMRFFKNEAGKLLKTKGERKKRTGNQS